MKEEYLVTWRWNDINYQRVCSDLSEAVRIRDKMITKGRFTQFDIGIHLRQLNKFGDPTTVDIDSEDYVNDN